MQGTSVTGIHQLLNKNTVRVGLVGETKAEVLDALINLLKSSPAVSDLNQVREAVFARETVMSTGVGKGLALPHAKTRAVKDTVAALAMTEHPVDFGAIDDRPVEILFLLVGTEEAKSQHIKILSRISRLMNRDAFRKELSRAADADEVLSIIEKGELALLEN